MAGDAPGARRGCRNYGKPPLPLPPWPHAACRMPIACRFDAASARARRQEAGATRTCQRPAACSACRGCAPALSLRQKVVAPDPDSSTVWKPPCLSACAACVAYGAVSAHQQASMSRRAPDKQGHARRCYMQGGGKQGDALHVLRHVFPLHLSFMSGRVISCQRTTQASRSISGGKARIGGRGAPC